MTVPKGTNQKIREGSGINASGDAEAKESGGKQQPLCLHLGIKSAVA
jgi:hypothetical protein